MASDKKFKETMYKVVLDPRSINWLKPEFFKHNPQGAAHLNKPIGAMSFQKPPTDDADADAPPAKAPKAPNASLLKKMNSPDFEPPEKANLKLILIEHEELPSSITLSLQIPLHECDAKYRPTKDGVNASITLYAPNFENLRIEDLQSIYTRQDNGDLVPISPEEEAKIPFIVKTPAKLFEAQVKSELRKLKFTFGKAGVSAETEGIMTQENLFTCLEVPTSADTSRALRVLR
jgi:hypothetical protein